MPVLVLTYQKMILALLFITLLPCLHMLLLLIMDFIVTLIFGEQGEQQAKEVE